MSHVKKLAVLAAVAATVTGACSGGSKASGPLGVSSPAFKDGALIPIGFTCAQANVSPPLAWSGVPSGTKEIAVVVADTDVTPGPFFHWVISGIKPGLKQLTLGTVPKGAVEAANGGGGLGYYGPCPPSGQVHHYQFTVYALGGNPGFKQAAKAADAVAAIEKQSKAKASMVGRFGR